MKQLILFIFLCIVSGVARAQCAMCRATVENSISQGHTEFAAPLNTGIIYLFVTPYVLAAVVAFVWFRSSRKNAVKNKIRIHTYR